MSIIYLFVKETNTQAGGIVLVEASPAAVKALAELGQPAALELKAILDTAGNAQSAVDYLTSALGNELAGTVKTIGSVAAGVAVGEAVAVVVAAGVAAFVALPYALLIGAFVGATVGGAAGQKIYDEGWDAAYKFGQAISPTTNTAFLAAKSWTAPRDPLVLDLDGDGIETAGIDPTAPVLFDMDGDGIKTATGWIRPDDGIVVLDRNGNGLIDSGRELFGDATVLARGARAGQLAANGFEALADLDLNADGRLDSLDASWGQLRIWRDLNQDGVSQAGELTTLAAQGIASLGAQGTQSNLDLGNGNTQVLSGSFTRTDGTLGASGVAEVAGSLLLASNNFYRGFTDEVALMPAVQGLPQMQGSRLVRNPSVYIGIDAGIASQFFRCSMFTEVMV